MAADARVKAIVVMGVSGCGKSTVGEGLAALLGYGFVEGDSLHPAANVEKMAAGIPLTDDDRWPWLDVIGDVIARGAASGIVVSCSALKKAYRDHLRGAAHGRLAFVFLDGSAELLGRRMGERKGHFMPAALLASQLATLEDPRDEPDVVTVDIDAAPEKIISDALAGIVAADTP